MIDKIRESTRVVKEYDKRFVNYIVVYALFNAFVSVVQILVSGEIVDSLTEGKEMKYVLGLMIGIAIANMIFMIIRTGCNRWFECRRYYISQRYEHKKRTAFFNVPYEKFETLEFADLRQRVRFSDDNMDAFGSLLGLIEGTINQVCNLAIFVGTAVFLFIKNISSLEALLGVLVAIVVIAALEVIAKKVLRRVQKASSAKVVSAYDDITKENRVAMYLAERIIFNYNMGKDIRIYNAKKLIENEFRQMIISSKKIYKRICKFTNMHSTIGDSLSEVISGAGYVMLFLMAFAKYISVGEIVIYAGVISNVVASINSLLVMSGSYDVVYGQMQATQKLFEIASEKKERHVENDEEKDNEACEITFENVSFCYPGTDTYALKDVSFTIGSNSKVSIVGENGAGKSTIVKLLAGLYRPTQGRILVNGKDIYEISGDKNENRLTVVYQDFRFFSFPLGENIGYSENVNQGGILRAIEAVEMKKIVEEKGTIDTVMFRDYDDNGMIFSGGELQKLAIARSVYSEAKYVLWDEPTSAMDVLREKEIMSLLSGMQEQAVLLVSHRLGASRFSDVIYVLDNGKIIQTGSHEELLRVGDGKYAEMWNAQAQYYI